MTVLVMPLPCTVAVSDGVGSAPAPPPHGAAEGLGVSLQAAEPNASGRASRNSRQLPGIRLDSWWGAARAWGGDGDPPWLGWACGSCSPSWRHCGAVGRVQVGWLSPGDVCSSPVISQVPRGRKLAAGLLCLRIRALAPSPQPAEVALGAGLQGRGRGRLCPHVGAAPPAPSGSG